ncbi:hypothetical protein VUR80DRAFT_6737 [Thermomyces stellatus]
MKPSFPTSPVSRRQHPDHSQPFDLMKYIPDPDSSSDESEADMPEQTAQRHQGRSQKRQKQPIGRSPKRLKPDGGAGATTNGAHQYHDEWIAKVNPAFRRKTSIDRSPKANHTPNRNGSMEVNKKKKRTPDGDTDTHESEDESEDEDASSSDEGSYRAIPLSTPKFNSNNVKLARPVYDVTSDKDDSSDSDSLDFSSKPKGTGAPKSSRFDYDDDTDPSSGEETSIPGTISHGKGNESQGPGAQKASGRAVPEPGEAEGSRSQSDSDSDSDDDDLGANSYDAVRSSQVRMVQPTESDSDSDDLGVSSYEAVRSSQVGMPKPTKSSHNNNASYLKARNSRAKAGGARTTGSGDESEAGRSGRSESEEVALTEGEPTEGSAVEKSGGSKSEEASATAQTTEGLDSRVEETSDESEGPRADSSDSDEDAPLPRIPKTPNEGAKSQSSSQSKKPPPSATAAKQSAKRPRVRTTKDAPSSKPKEGPGKLGRLAEDEDRILDSTIERFLKEHGLTNDKVPSLVKGEDGETEEATRLRHDFWTAVYDSFPHRSPRYVRAIVKRRHTKYSLRPEKWGEEEDAKLVELAEKHREDRNKWLTIGKELNRTPAECRDRYRNYALCGPGRKIGPWKAKDLRWFLNAVSRFIPEDEEKGDSPGGTKYKIDWLEVSRNMGGRRSRQQCLAKWNKMGVNPNKLRVRQLLHGRDPDMSPELRTVLMQAYSTPEEKLRWFVLEVGEYEVVGDLPIPWRKLAGGKLTRELRVETLNIIWMRLRKGLAKGMEGKSDHEVARTIYAVAVEDPGCLEREVERQDGDTEAEEAIVRKPWKGLSTRASFGRGE